MFLFNKLNTMCRIQSKCYIIYLFGGICSQGYIKMMCTNSEFFVNRTFPRKIRRQKQYRMFKKRIENQQKRICLRIDFLMLIRSGEDSVFISNSRITVFSVKINECNCNLFKLIFHSDIAMPNGIKYGGIFSLWPA